MEKKFLEVAYNGRALLDNQSMWSIEGRICFQLLISRKAIVVIVVGAISTPLAGLNVEYVPISTSCAIEQRVLYCLAGHLLPSISKCLCNLSIIVSFFWLVRRLDGISEIDYIPMSWSVRPQYFRPLLQSLAVARGVRIAKIATATAGKRAMVGNCVN